MFPLFVCVYHIGFKTNFGVKIMKNNYLVVLSIVNSTMLFILNIVFTMLAMRLYVEYGWKIYKRVRFHVRLRAAFHVYELVICLLKMVLLFVWMFAICLNRTVLRNHETGAAFIVSLITIPAIIIVSFVGVIAIRKEIRLLMYFFFFCLIGAIGYFLFKLLRVASATCTGCEEFSTHTEDIPDEVRLHLIYLASVGIFFLLVLLVASCKAFRNFGTGLKNHFEGKPNATITMLNMSQDVLTSILNTSMDHIDTASNDDLTDRLQLSGTNLYDVSNKRTGNEMVKTNGIVTSTGDVTKSANTQHRSPEKQRNLVVRLAYQTKRRFSLLLGDSGSGDRTDTDLEFSPRREGCTCCFVHRNGQPSRDAYCQTDVPRSHENGYHNEVCLSEEQLAEYKRDYTTEFSSKAGQFDALHHRMAHRQASLPTDYPVRTAAIIANRIEYMKGNQRRSLARSVSDRKFHRDLEWYHDVDVIPEEKDECYSSCSENSIDDDDVEDGKEAIENNDVFEFTVNREKTSSEKSVSINNNKIFSVKRTTSSLSSLEFFVPQTDTTTGRISSSYPVNTTFQKSSELRRAKSSIASLSSVSTDISYLGSTSGDLGTLEKPTNTENCKSEPSGEQKILKRAHSSPGERCKRHTFGGDFMKS